jgi:pimeloyl-ACP methyl ester carboxylesterase
MIVQLVGHTPTGANDPWTPLAGGLHPGDKFTDYCDSLKLVVLQNTGHCPHDERPDECHNVIFPFLANLPAAQ